MTKDQAASTAGDRLAALELWSRRTFFATLLVLTAGCAGPVASSPVTRPVAAPKAAAAASLPRLAALSKVIACDPYGEREPGQVNIYLPNCPWKGPTEVPYLRVGDRAWVYGDHRPDKASQLKARHGRMIREVDVQVETGEWAGKFGMVDRANLSPIGGGQ